MADFLLFMGAHKNAKAPFMVHKNCILQATPCLKGDAEGVASWVQFTGDINNGHPMLVYGAPEQILEALSLEQRCASLVPVDDPDTVSGIQNETLAARIEAQEKYNAK